MPLRGQRTLSKFLKILNYAKITGTCLFIQTISVLSNLPDIFLLYLIPVKKTAVANKTSRQPSEQSA